MDTPSQIRSRLSAHALRHLEEAAKVEEYRPAHTSKEDLEGFAQLQKEGLVVPFPSGSSNPGPFHKITELGRQVLSAT